MPDQIRIPADPEKRAALAKFAGLSDNETFALNAWCFMQASHRERGVLMYETEPRVTNANELKSWIKGQRCPYCIDGTTRDIEGEEYNCDECDGFGFRGL